MARLGIRTFGVAVCAAAMLGAGAGTAAAGEIGGSGRWTPINPGGLSAGDGVAASECAFSGLNDGYLDGTEAARVQSFGQMVRVTGPLGGIPGMACRPLP